MSSDIAQLDAVRFSYLDREVLKGASFSLAPGEFCVLVGSNGAGKTTLIRLLLGELAPAAGTVSVCGTTPADAVSSRFIGYVPQQSPEDYRHFPATVLEAVRAMVSGRSHQRKSTALAVIEAVGLGPMAHKSIGELSGGQFQLLLLARALVNKPRLLLLDESTSNLDNVAADRLASIAGKLADTGSSILLVTHDIVRLPPVYDRVIQLSDGVIHTVQ